MGYRRATCPNRNRFRGRRGRFCRWNTQKRGHEPERTGFRAMLTTFVAIKQSFPPRNRSLLVYTYLGYLPPIWIPPIQVSRVPALHPRLDTVGLTVQVSARIQCPHVVRT